MSQPKLYIDTRPESVKRAEAREHLAQEYHKHEKESGRFTSFEECKRHINERADRLDNQKDRK